MFTRKTTTSLIPVRLGALFVAANLLRADAMANALMIARQSGRKIGDLLVSQQLISSEDLASALELQKLIKEGSITVEMGTRALKQAHEERTGLKSALTDLGWTDENSVKTQDIASLLTAAGCIKQEQLQQARWNASSNHLPLGRNLVLTGAITPSLLGAALNALILIRDHKLGFDSAVEALKICAARRVPLEDAIDINVQIEPNHVRVGELLSGAGLLSESDAMNAVENGLLNQRSIGQILLESQMVSHLVLDAAIKLQKMIEEHQTSRQQASELIRQVATKQVALDDFLSEMSYLKRRALEVLTDSGLVESAEVAIALESCPQGETDPLRALLMSGSISQELFRAAVRCVYTIDSSETTQEEAYAKLRYQFGRTMDTNINPFVIQPPELFNEPAHGAESEDFPDASASSTTEVHFEPEESEEIRQTA